MSYSHRCIKGFQEADRIEVERIVLNQGFHVYSFLRISGELEVSIAYDPSFAAKCNVLEITLREKVSISIHVV